MSNKPFKDLLQTTEDECSDANGSVDAAVQCHIADPREVDRAMKLESGTKDRDATILKYQNRDVQSNIVDASCQTK